MGPIRSKQARKQPTHLLKGSRRRPVLELLEERLQPGETILFGISALALWSSASDLLDPPLRAENTESSLPYNSLTMPAAFRWAARVHPVEDSLLTVGRSATTGSELASTGVRDDPLAVGAMTRQSAVSQLSIAGLVASVAPPSSGLDLLAVAGISPANPGEQLFPLFQADGASSGTVLSSGTHSVVAELAPGSMRFEASIGQLTIRRDGQDNTVRQTLTRDGFVEVTLDGRAHSSDPASAAFDPGLAGARADTLTAIRFDGSGQDKLILDHDQLTGGFTISAAGAAVATQEIAAAGLLAIEARSITVSQALRGQRVALSASGLLSIEAEGQIKTTGSEVGGRIELAADVLVNAGQIHADGPMGGQVVVESRNVLNAGPITAAGQTGDGGAVGIRFSGAYVGTVAGTTSANGVRAGTIRIDGGSTGRLYSSGSHLATGTHGGQVDLLGREVVLPGATVDASGQNAGGTVRIGGDFHGRNPDIVNAQTVTVTGATTIRANASDSGSGGRVAIWSDGETDFVGSIAAHGGASGGDGGFVEVSGKDNLKYEGSGDAGARRGRTGTLLLDPKNIVISREPVGVFPQFQLIDPHPTQGGGFGNGLTVLSTGNVVVVSPNDNFGGTNAGAVYLFDALSGALLSSLVGSGVNERLGYRVNPLTNGNFVVNSSWNGVRGAVTWADGRTGVSGTVSETNSLVGSNPFDGVGDVAPLSNGNYLVISRDWNSRRGAVTWGDGRTGVRGPVSEANSLTGSNPDDFVGHCRFEPCVSFLSNGNYVVESSLWNGSRGAVTWGDGTSGVRGRVSEANSLVGSSPGDGVGNFGVARLSNSNYLVQSPGWNDRRGAATWGDGTAGVRGPVSDTNSLVGSNPGDGVGDPFAVTPLNNGNYLIRTPFWNASRGAVTWEDSRMGVRGAVSDANSLVGSNIDDRVGYAVTPLSNGNYLVQSPSWASFRGAVTWGDGRTGVRGAISDANSLVGTRPNGNADGVGSGGVTFLSNGNYVVQSPPWNRGRGAATWGMGALAFAAPSPTPTVSLAVTPRTTWASAAVEP